MEIADVLGLGKFEELRPRQRERILAAPANFEPPGIGGDDRGIPEIEDRPVRHRPLSDRQLGHAVAILRSRALRGPALERHVDTFLVQRALPLNVTKPFVDERFSHWE
jgi:hypothetical protein